MGLSLGALILETRGARLTFFGRRDAPPEHPIFQRPEASYAARFPGPAPAGGVVLLAVPDDAVARVASELAEEGEAMPGAVVLHLSGALPSAVLAPLRDRGYAAASLHPLQTVAAPERGAEMLRGITFAFEGEDAARPAAEEIVGAAGGRMISVPAAAKPEYHAACVFASNYVVASAAVAARLLSRTAGIPEPEALAALLPLVEGARANLERWGLPRALTGPVARGDVEVIRRHLGALDGPTRALYCAQAREALRLARSSGLDPRRADEIERLLSEQDAALREPGSRGDRA